MSCCHPTIQTNMYDREDVPQHLAGLVAPLAVWDYLFAMQRRCKRLEAQLAAASLSVAEPGSGKRTPAKDET
jgi:hypothetical protein